MPGVGPLEGIRVLDFSQVIAGPFGCMMLADMGAEVIKIEPPGGEAWRVISEFAPKESKSFQSLNRGKRSLVLRLDDPEAQQIVHRLVPSVDIVVMNYRPDVSERLRIDYATLAALRPDLIYVDNTAFGREGPRALDPGYDIVVQAATGLMVTDGKLDPAGTPRPISPALADLGTGLAIAWAASTALYHRERTGEGQFVQTSLLATALNLQSGHVMRNPAADARVERSRAKRRELREAGAPFADQMAARRPAGAGLFYRAYLTRDGAIAVGALSKSLRAKMRKVVGTDFLGRDDPNFDLDDAALREESRRATDEVEATIAAKTTDEWLDLFREAGVPVAPVEFPEDLSQDPQVVANGLMVDVDHPVTGPQRVVGPLIKFGNFAPQVESSPALGQHTDPILERAGYTREEVERLRAAGVVE